MKTMTNKTLPPGNGRPLQPAHSAAAVMRYFKTQWPRIGGTALKPLPANAFQDPRFTEHYEPGILVRAYVAACGQITSPTNAIGLLGAARDLNLPLYKVASTECADIRRRTDALNRDRYGSHRKLATGGVFDPGFDRWTFQQILPTREPLRGAPVTLEARSVDVILPAGVSSGEFEKRLHQAMSNASLNSWLEKSDGVAHCALVGLDPREQQRFTALRFGKPARISPAEEIYIFRPIGEDADRLLTIIETIIYQLVLGTASPANPLWSSASQHAGRRDGAPFDRRHASS